MVERWLFYFKHNQNADDLEEQLMKRLEADDNEGAEALLDGMKSRSFEAETIRPALKYLDGVRRSVRTCATNGSHILLKQSRFQAVDTELSDHGGFLVIEIGLAVSKQRGLDPRSLPTGVVR